MGIDIRSGMAGLMVPGLLAGCGAAVQDRTPSTLARDPAGLYPLTVRVEGASPGTTISGVQAVTSVGSFAMAPAGLDPK